MTAETPWNVIAETYRQAENVMEIDFGWRRIRPGEWIKPGGGNQRARYIGDERYLHGKPRGSVLIRVGTWFMSHHAARIADLARLKGGFRIVDQDFLRESGQ